MKRIYFVVLAFFVILYMVVSIRKNKLSVTNSFFWIVFCICMLLLSIFPKSLDFLADLVGISYPPALFLTFAVVVLFVMNFIYSKKIEVLSKKVTDLAQELSVVREEVNEKKK